MKELPTRKKNRLQNYDYSKCGAYFVTICAKNRLNLFGEIVGADTIRPQISETGKIVEDAIITIPNIYTVVSVEHHVIMPNHVHMIIMIHDDSNGGRIISAPTISKIVGYFKQSVSRNIGFSPWQKSFHDHIIRDEKDYLKIAEYIENNPQNWEKDCFYEAVPTHDEIKIIEAYKNGEDDYQPYISHEDLKRELGLVNVIDCLDFERTKK